MSDRCEEREVTREAWGEMVRKVSVRVVSFIAALREKCRLTAVFPESAHESGDRAFATARWGRYMLTSAVWNRGKEKLGEAEIVDKIERKTETRLRRETGRR